MKGLYFRVEGDGELYLTKAGKPTGGTTGVRERQLLMDALNDIGKEVQRTAQTLAPVGKTGALKESIGMQRAVFSGPNTLKGSVGLRRHPSYGIFVHEGTGIFGKFHRPIFSPAGRKQKFQNMAGQTIFRRFTKGQEPQPFLQEAILLVENTYAPVRVRELAAQIRALR